MTDQQFHPTNSRETWIVTIALVVITIIGIQLFSITPVILLLSALALLSSLGAYIFGRRVERLKTRNDKLRVELLIDGAMEAELKEELETSLEHRQKLMTLRRRASNLRDAGDRAQMIMEITKLSSEVDDTINSIEDALVRTKTMKQDFIRTNNELRAAENRLRILRQQESMIYRTRRLIEERFTAIDSLERRYATDS